MSVPEISQEQLTLILEALQDAAFYRDSRSRVLKSAVNKTIRRTNAMVPHGGGADIHREKALAYHALADKLRRGQ